MALIDLLRITLSPWTVLRNLSEIFNDLVLLGRKVSNSLSSSGATWDQPGDGGGQDQLSFLRFVSRELTKDGETRQEARDL